jgi:hypothetical protein
MLRRLQLRDEPPMAASFELTAMQPGRASRAPAARGSPGVQSGARFALTARSASSESSPVALASVNRSSSTWIFAC